MMGEESDLKDEGVSHKSEQELIKLFKRRLENWREVLTYLYAVITWEKPFFPGVIAGVVTIIFIMLWYFDPSVLTTLSIFGIIACVMDYVVPILSSSVFDSSKWTGAQERKYEEICASLVSSYLTVKSIWDSVRQIKESKPYIYFVAVLGTLFATAWIGNLIDNLFLTYMIVIFMSLLPGIKSQSHVQKYLSQGMAMITGGQSKKKK